MSALDRRGLARPRIDDRGDHSARRRCCAADSNSSASRARAYSARAIRLVEETVVIDMLNQFRFADFAEKPPRSQKWMATTGSFAEKDWEVYRTSGIKVFGLGHGARNV